MATFPVVSSVADEDALAAWAEASYALSSPVTCRYERRSMSDAYRVESGGDAYYLKVYSPGRHDAGTIDAEIRFILDLRGRGLRVVEPVAKADGAYTAALPMPEGPRQAALFRAIDGAEVHEENPDHSAAFGELLARIHAAGDESDDRYARWELDERRLVHESVDLLAAHMTHRPDDEAFLRATGEEIADELCGLLPKTPPFYGICHGDAHAGNALLPEDGRPILFDFDSCGYGWRALDIGAYAVSYDWMDLSAEMKRKKERVVEALLEGYARVRPMGDAERVAIDLAEPIRHLELLGLGVRNASRRDGIGWLDDDFIDTHIGWLRRWRGEYRGL
ncbi:hypothetical protein CMK11_21790 [Candidatus Poribacteria bacterium]|nr:hypothetical protein [Candidatus Poribacteria bacterium]